MVFRQLARSEEQPDPAAGGPTECDVAVVFALAIEAGGLIDLADAMTVVRGHRFVVRHGAVQGRNVLIAISGAGAARAERATEALIHAHQPRWLISAGFAGGLDPELVRHDLVMADALVDATGQRVALDFDARLAALTRSIHVGALLTTDKVVRSPNEKRALGQQHAALAVDTESMAVWRACQPRHVPMLAIRVLTDAVDERLPADIQRLTDQTTPAARLGAALAAIWRRPKSVKDLWALKETALVGSDRLAQFLVRVITTLS